RFRSLNITDSVISDHNRTLWTDPVHVDQILEKAPVRLLTPMLRGKKNPVKKRCDMKGVHLIFRKDFLRVGQLVYLLPDCAEGRQHFLCTVINLELLR